MPNISVIVPVYNVEKYLNKCVESILSQTYADFELILVDDGSPDKCPKMCDGWRQKDERVVVIHQKNQGLSAARNTGIDWAFKNSNSEWLTFVDSDDWLHPQYLEILISAALKNNVNISKCLEKNVYSRADVEEKNIYNECISEVYSVDDDAEYVLKHFTNACFTLYRKSLYKQLRFPVGKLHEDVYITYLILFNEKHVVQSKVKLYYYFFNTESITRVKWRPQRLDEINAHEERIEFFSKKSFKKALKAEVNTYLGCMAVQINQISNSDEEYYVYKKKLKLKLRKKMVRYFFWMKFNGNEWIYDAAFPKIMKLFWLYRAFLNRMSKKHK